MDPILLGIVGLVSLAIGLLGGVIFVTLRNEKKGSEAPEPPPPPGPAESAAAPEYMPVADFLRAKDNGPLLVRMDGKIIDSKEGLSSDQQACLEDLLLELRTWLGYQPYTAEQHLIEPMPDQLGDALFGEDNKVFTSVMPSTSVAPVSTPPFTGSKTIVGQIDDILQEKLLTTEYASRRIRLIEKPNQGVVVQIGLEQYPGIEEVPDPEIRNLIHQSVAEWEVRAR